MRRLASVEGRLPSVEGLVRVCADERVTEGSSTVAPREQVDSREGSHGHVLVARCAAADHDELERTPTRARSGYDHRGVAGGTIC